MPSSLNKTHPNLAFVVETKKEKSTYLDLWKVVTIPALFIGDKFPSSLSCPPEPSATLRGLFHARMPKENPVGKSKREASVLHFLSSLGPSCGGTPRLPSHPGAVHLRVIVPFPSPTPGGRASGVAAVPAAGAPLFLERPTFSQAASLAPIKGPWGCMGNFSGEIA